MRKSFSNTTAMLVAMALMAMPFGLALAGDYGHGDHAQAKGDMGAKMEMMKAEFAKCDICKNMLPYWDSVMPSMKSEVAKLDKGMALMYSTSDPSKVASLHEMCDKMYVAGDAAAKYSDADVKAKLCQYCQGMVGLTKAGATMSHGATANGNLLIFSSADRAVQEKIAAMRVVCETQVAAGN